MLFVVGRSTLRAIRLVDTSLQMERTYTPEDELITSNVGNGQLFSSLIPANKTDQMLTDKKEYKFVDSSKLYTVQNSQCFTSCTNTNGAINEQLLTT